MREKGFAPILIIIVAIVVISAAYYLGTQKGNILPTPTQTPTITATSYPTQFMPTAKPTSEPISTWKTFKNDTLGISFKYPASFGDFSLNFASGDTGKIFYGVFSQKSFIAMGGITEDYTVGRSGDFFDFAKYLNESGKYFHLFALGKKFLIEPTKIITVDKEQILLVNGNSYVDERGIEGPTINPGEGTGALINLPNGGIYQGLAIRNLDSSISQTEFEQILSTFKFIK